MEEADALALMLRRALGWVGQAATAGESREAASAALEVLARLSRCLREEER